MKKANVLKLIKEGDKVVGVEYEKDGKNVSPIVSLVASHTRLGGVFAYVAQYTEHGAVVLATGGYAADFTPDSLLKKHRPEYYDLVSSCRYPSEYC